MRDVYNIESDRWIRPWNVKKFDDLSTRDERFFSILIKGFLGFMTRNLVLYDEPIKHFILNTGSAYLYVEANGYELSWSETSGEDQMYMKMPRCVCEVGDIEVPTDELTNPFVNGTYERLSSKDNQYHGYNAEIRRLPIALTMNLRYVLSNFNEALVLIQEMFDKMSFQRYFTINYLGQRIECSIEFPTQNSTTINKIDFDSTEVNQKTIEISLRINSSYPIVNVDTEIENSKIISKPAVSFGISGNDSLIYDTEEHGI